MIANALRPSITFVLQRWVTSSLPFPTCPSRDSLGAPALANHTWLEPWLLKWRYPFSQQNQIG